MNKLPLGKCHRPLSDDESSNIGRQTFDINSKVGTGKFNFFYNKKFLTYWSIKLQKYHELKISRILKVQNLNF